MKVGLSLIEWDTVRYRVYCLGTNPLGKSLVPAGTRPTNSEREGAIKIEVISSAAFSLQKTPVSTREAIRLFSGRHAVT